MSLSDIGDVDKALSQDHECPGQLQMVVYPHASGHEIPTLSSRSLLHFTAGDSERVTPDRKCQVVRTPGGWHR